MFGMWKYQFVLCKNIFREVSVASYGLIVVHILCINSQKHKIKEKDLLLTIRYIAICSQSFIR